jgi:hypothetical protein
MHLLLLIVCKAFNESFLSACLFNTNKELQIDKSVFLLLPSDIIFPVNIFIKSILSSNTAYPLLLNIDFLSLVVETLTDQLSKHHPFG